MQHLKIGLKYTGENILYGPADISGSRGQADELAEDVQKREFLGLDAVFEFTTHFKFSFLPSTFAEEGSRKILSWLTAAT